MDLIINMYRRSDDNMDKREQRLNEIEKEQNADNKKNISHVIHLSDPLDHIPVYSNG